MDAIITKLIAELNTSVFVLLIILVGMGWVLVKIGEWKETFRHHKDRIGSLENLSEKVIVMSTKIDLIYNYTNPNSMVKSRSPISLTDEGVRVSESIKANAILDKYYSRLKKEVDSNDPQNAYDIQKYAMSIVKEKMIAIMDANEITLIKDTAFKKGTLMEDILSIFGILLRDKILEERGISTTEIDYHAPPSQ